MRKNTESGVMSRATIQSILKDLVWILRALEEVETFHRRPVVPAQPVREGVDAVRGGTRNTLNTGEHPGSFRDPVEESPEKAWLWTPCVLADLARNLGEVASNPRVVSDDVSEVRLPDQRPAMQ